jgi:hypothetical protein
MIFWSNTCELQSRSRESGFRITNEETHLTIYRTTNRTELIQERPFSPAFGNKQADVKREASMEQFQKRVAKGGGATVQKLIGDPSGPDTVRFALS